jgi:cytochrome P450 family 9
LLIKALIIRRHPFFEDLNKFHANMHASASDLMKYFEKQSEEATLLFDTKDLFEKFLSNVIAMIVLGKGSNCIYDESSKVHEIVNLIDNNLNSLSGEFKLFLLNHFPWIAKVFSVRIFAPKVYNFLIEHVKEEMEFRRRRKIENRSDFLQLMMSVDDIELIYAQVFMFLTTGISTTSSLFQACCFVIAKNQELQRELIQHCDSVENFNDFMNDEFVNKLINEVLRKWYVVACETRICSQDVTIESKAGEKFKFLKGDIIHIPYRLIFNDPLIFDDPKLFDINRSGNRDDYMPIGPRKCIGENLAMLEVKIILFHILQKYTMHSCSQTPDDLSFSCTQSGFHEKVIVELKARKL